MPTPTKNYFALLASVLTLGACDLGVTNPNVIPEAGSITVDAAASYAYVNVDGDTLAPVAITTSGTSTNWAIGFFGTTVTTNGGAAGPGGVEIACLCVNELASNAEVQAMTLASESAEFDTVTAGAATTATFSSDQLATAISGWYAGSGAAATIVAGRTWILREGSPTAVLSKMRILSITGASATAMGTVKLEFSAQPSAGTAFSTTDTLEFTVGTDPVYVDLTSGAVTSASNWDLQFSGWTIRVNSGVSGSGTVRAVLDATTAYDAITHTYAATAPAQAFSTDSFRGVFATKPWYRYNITGTDNQIWPTFNVYLVRRAGVLLKVQLVNYYGPTGTPRQITIRYQRLAN